MEDFDRVQGFSSSCIGNLVATTCARGGDERGSRRGPYGRKQHEFADLHRESKMLPLVAERAGHSAATAGNHLDAKILRQR